MQDNEILKLAESIFTTGRLIHDRILKLQTGYVTEKRGGSIRPELSLPQLFAIMTIEKSDPVSMTRLSELLGVSPPSASAMVDRLVERGLLAREHSATDRRRVTVRVSPDIRRDVKGIETVILHSFVDLIDEIGLETARQWNDVLVRVGEVLAREKSSTGHCRRKKPAAERHNPIPQDKSKT